MSEKDPFDLPPIRVKKADPNAVFPTPQDEDDVDLAEMWLEAWAAKRDAEATMTKLRAKIEAKLEAGQPVAGSSGYVIWQTSTAMKADSQALLKAIGADVYAQFSEVSATKLKELIVTGRVDKDAPFIKHETVKRLVTKVK